MKKHPMLKYLKAEGPAGPRLPIIHCPGCGAGQVLNFTLHAVDRLIEKEGAAKDDFLFVSGVGCSSRITSHYLNFDSAWTIHGRALAVATGAQMVNPKLRITVFTGDGDLAAIGGNHFIHACRRNMNLTVICINNGLYGMTGGQISPTSAPGLVTTTTPYGNHEGAFDLCRIAEAAGAVYVARWTTAHPRQMVKSIRKGIKKRGLAFIEVLSQCPVHRKMAPTDMLTMFRQRTVRLDKKDETNQDRIPIGEFVDQERIDWIGSHDRAAMREQERDRLPHA